jgi:hypothetical protein
MLPFFISNLFSNGCLGLAAAAFWLQDKSMEMSGPIVIATSASGQP